MKKILSISLIASFIFGSAAFLPAMAQEDGSTSAETTVENNGVKANAGDSMEKILSPDQIRFFKNIIKRGTALFGIKKEKMIEKKAAIASSTDQDLEKISAPQFIGLYEKVRKVGNALWGYKKEGKENKGRKEEKRRLVTSEMSACVITAIETKDAALAADNTAFASELNAAIAARTACQKTALGSTENQAANLDACVKTFNKTFKASREENKKDHNSVWKAYKDGLKTCADNAVPATGTSTSTETAAETVSSDDSQGEVMIEDGGGNITEAVSSEESQE